MLWCATSRDKSKLPFEGKSVLVPQFEMEDEELEDARVGLTAPSMRVESKVEARVGGDDAQPDEELQNVEVVAKGRAARLCSTWYVFAACVGAALLLHAVDASNEAFLGYESSSGLESLTDATPLQLGKMQRTREEVFGSVKVAVLGLAGVCVAIACLLAVHSDLLNAYPTSAKRLASCAAESTACRFLYSTAVGCTSMLAVVVAALLLAGSVGVYALSVQEVQVCGFATKVLTPAVSWVAGLGDLGEELGDEVGERVSQLPHSVGQLEMQAGQLVERADLASLCSVSAPLRAAAFFGGAICAQAAAVGTLAFDIADPDGARLASRLVNKTEQLAWQAVHSGAVPPLPLLVTDARLACYQLSLLALAADDLCLVSPLPPTLAAAPHVAQLRLRRALDAFRAATLALIDTSPALAHALGTLADQLGEAFLGSASRLLESLEAAVDLLQTIEEKLDAGVAEAMCELVHEIEQGWLLGACGAALLTVAMIGCRLAASADVWHYYTLMPLGPLLAGVPALGRACMLLAALAAALVLVAGGMAHATVAGAAAAARPLLGPLVAIDLQALLSLPTTVHLAVYLIGLSSPLLALLLAATAWQRGRTVLSRRAAFPAWPFKNAGTWAAHVVLTALRTLLANLLGLGALLFSLVTLLAMGGAVGVFAYSASRVHALQADALSGALAERIDGYAAVAATFLDEAAPLLATAHTVARGFVTEEPLLAVYQAAHTESLLLEADYTETCAAVAATGGVSQSNGLSSCADAMPPLALALYLLSLSGLLPMPHPQPHQTQHQQAALPLSRAQIAAATARGLGFGAVYGGRADAAGLGAIAAEYGGATESYYRTLGPLCSDVHDAWAEVSEVCAATRRVVTEGWSRPSVADATALKHRLAETAVLVLSDIDRTLAPLLAPWTRHGVVHDTAALVLYLDADRLHAAVNEVHQLDAAPLLDALGGATDKLVLLWLLCAAAAALTLLVCAAAWYAVSRYTLFLALVDFHAFKRAAPAWDLPGALQKHLSKALTKAVSGTKAAGTELQEGGKQAGSTLATGRLPQLSTDGKGLLGLPKLPFLKERVPGEPAAGGGSGKLKALL